MNEVTATGSPYKDGRMNVRDFYHGKKVFLTGGTGFIGTVLIERLLRQFAVETIYVLVREKKGKNIHSRIDELTDGVYYDLLKEQDPKFKHKIVPVNGDCSLAGLGLTIHDVQMLVEHVDIVIHCAATVRFNERLDKAYTINVTGTESIINLCHQIKNLKAFLHVSTAYSNCHLRHIEEKFYDYTLSAEKVSQMVAKLSPVEIEKATPDIIQDWPNTYSFTKALAESLVREKCANLPVAVFRPAIVLSTYKGATPGWIDNLYGPVGGTASIYAGFSRVVYIKEANSCNIVPVDKVADGILAATWEVGTRMPDAPNKNEIVIYNYVSAMTKNDITWPEFILNSQYYGRKYPLPTAKTSIEVACISTRPLYNILIFFYHYMPALIIDFFLLLAGKKPTLFNLYKRVHKHMESVMFFVEHAWSFNTTNVEQLYDTMNYEDRELLPMNILDVNWMRFQESYVLGIRKYLLKENESTIEMSRKRFVRFCFIKSILTNIIFFVVAGYLYTTFTRILFN